MCSYDGSGSWPYAFSFFAAAVASFGWALVTRKSPAKPLPRALFVLAALLLAAAVWAFAEDPFTSPKPCSQADAEPLLGL